MRRGNQEKDKEISMSSNFKLSLVLAAAIAIALAAIATPALATQWNKGVYLDLDGNAGAETGTWLWNDANNWNAGVPVAGSTADFMRYNWAKPVGIDTVGAMLNLGSAGKLTGQYNGSVEVIFDSTYLTPVYKATPVPNTLLNSATSFTPVAPATTLEQAAAASPMMTVATMDFSKEHQVYLYHPLTVNNLNDNGSAYYFYGPVTVNTQVNLVGRDDTSDVIDFRNTTSTPLMTIQKGTVNAYTTLTATTINLTQLRAIFNAKAADSAGGAGATINVNNGLLNFQVAQTAFPAMVKTAAYAAIRGDFTGAVYTGPGQNVNLGDNTILAITAGPLPTDPNTSVKDAKYWLAATSPLQTAVYEASNDPNSIYKGIAFANSLMDTGNAKCTFQTAAGSDENLQVLITGGGRKKEGTMTWLSETGVADVYCNSQSLTGDTGGINESYAGPRTKVTTFNFYNLNTADGYQQNDLYNHGGGAKILAGQTYTTQGGRINVSVGNIHGRVDVNNGGMLYLGNLQLNASATAQYNINNGGAVTLANRVDSLELLTSGQIAATGTTAVGFGFTTINFNAAAQLRLYELLAVSDVALNYHNDTTWTFSGDGLKLADGKFLMTGGWQNKLTKIAAASVFGAATGASSIGLMAGSGQFLQIDCPLSLGSGVDLNVNSATREVVCNSNYRDTQGGRVILNSATTAKNIKVAAGEVEFYDASDLVLAGKVIVTGGTVRIGPTSDQFNDTQPVHMQFDGGMLNCYDATALSISTSNIAMNSGSYGYFTPSETRVHDLSIAEKFVNGSAGVRVNDAADVLTVTGTLSGDGGWGGSGTMKVEGTLAPGASVGELAGQTKLELADNAVYAWQIANADAAGGTPGEDWDVVTAANMTLAGHLVFNVDAAGMTGTLAETDELIVASATTGTITATAFTYEINAPGWSGTGTLTVSLDNKNLILSGLASVAPVLTGDTNGDGVVDAADFITLKQNFGTPTGATLAQGDFNTDEAVNWADLDLLTGNIGPGSGAPPATTPEPATLGLLALGALAMVRRRRS